MPYRSRDQGLINIALDDLKRSSPEKHAQALADIDGGAVVEMECSSFRDHGDDWSRLLVNGKVVSHRGGY